MWINAKEQHLLCSQITTSKPDNGASINLWLAGTIMWYWAPSRKRLKDKLGFFSLKAQSRRLRTIPCQICDHKPSLIFIYQYNQSAFLKIIQTGTWRMIITKAKCTTQITDIRSLVPEQVHQKKITKSFSYYCGLKYTHFSDVQIVKSAMYFQICIGKCGDTGSPQWSLESCLVQLTYLENGNIWTAQMHKNIHTHRPCNSIFSQKKCVSRHSSILYLEKYTKWKDWETPAVAPLTFYSLPQFLARMRRTR